MKGFFISMEGSDGCGKTTQMNLLEEELRERGYSLVRSREPGGTPISEKLRDIILDPENTEMAERTEALLYAASRAQHVEEKIKPVLAEGGIFLSDRFYDSSIAYQGIGRGLGVETIERLNQWATDGVKPDLTIILYLDYDEGLKRKNVQTEGHLDRLESAEESFHRRVNEGFLALAERDPERIVVVDASRSIEEIHKDVMKIVLKALRRR